MTRINTIPPQHLSDQHLLAETREIVRIPRTTLSGKAKINLNKIPKDFRLGKLHVTYFYNKQKWLHNRYNDLRKECLERGFNISDYNSTFKDLPNELYKDWKPTPQSIKLIKERILDRMLSMRSIRYYGEEVGRQHFKTLYNENN